MAPFFQKANLIFGAGMLEMGVTFSFEQLVLDNAIIDNISALPTLAKLPEDLTDPTYIKDLVATYRGKAVAAKGTPTTKKPSLSPTEAHTMVDEILHSHSVPALDRPTRERLRKIVDAAQ